MTTFTITYDGQTSTRTSKTRVYNFASVVQSPEGEITVGWKWSSTYKGAEKTLCADSIARGWRVIAVLPCQVEGQEPAPAAEAPEPAPAEEPTEEPAEAPAEKPVKVYVDWTSRQGTEKTGVLVFASLGATEEARIENEGKAPQLRLTGGSRRKTVDAISDYGTESFTGRATIADIAAQAAAWMGITGRLEIEEHDETR